MMSRGPATLRDVAGHAGVAISTVSAYINQTRPITPELAVRIRDAIRELDFVPNAQARNLRMRRAASIGLIVPELSNPFFAFIAEGIEDRISREQMTLTLSQTGPTGAREDFYAELLPRARVDGIIVVSNTGKTPMSIMRLIERFPVVLADEYMPGIRVPFVGSDNRRGARTVGELALSSGRRRAAVITGPEGLWSAEARLAGYREALASYSFAESDVPIVRGDYTFDSGVRAATSLFIGAPATNSPDVLLAANDLMALGAMRVIRKAGLRIPEDVVVVGFDDIPAADMMHPSLTTVSQSAFAIGQTAADLLLRTIAGEDLGDERIELPTSVVRRSTTID